MIKYKLITYKFILYIIICFFIPQIQAQERSSADSLIRVNDAKQTPGILFNLSSINSTSAVSTVLGEQLQKTPTANLTNTLYGRLPGLSVIQGHGEPGSDAASINIRGVGSYTYGSYAIFVDGFQSKLSYAQYLSADEIESLSVFKDAASLAPFGMKGANGVIWIITKRGQIGKPHLKLQFRTGVQQLENITKPLQSYDYAQLYNEAYSNDNGRVWNPKYSQAQLDAYKNGTGINSDWYAETLKPSTPFNSTDISFKGGTQSARYFIALNYTGTNGFYNVQNDELHSNSRMQKYNIRSNFDFTLFKYIDGKMDFGGRIEDRSNPAFNNSTLWTNLERYPNNIYPVNNDNGTWTGTTVYPNNPVASTHELGIFTMHDRSMQMNFTLKERLDMLLKGFYLSEAVSFSNWTRGSRNVTKDYARYIGTETQTPNMNTNYTISDDYGTNQWDWRQWQVTAGYDKKIGMHKIASAFNYLQSLHKVDADQNGSAGINTQYGFVNLSGRVNYSYNEKYTAELGFGYSGSDNYRPGNQYVFYPALSAGWIVSKERFMQKLNFVDFLKLRLSAGQVGYDGFSGGRYLYELYYKYQGSYPTGNGTPNYHGAIVQAYLPNADITAEKSTKYNVGIDSKLFKGISLTIDGFMDNRFNILSVDNSIMSIVGIDAPYRNIGKVTTKGAELTINYDGKINDFTYNFGVMGTYITNKIDYMAELITPSTQAMQTGKPIGTPIGYEAIGFYDVSDFDSNGNLNSLPVPSLGKVQPGDIKYRNLNDDNVIDERDKKAIGKSSFPELTYAFTAKAGYKDFDLSFVLQGVTGRDVNLLSGAYNKIIAFENNGNVYAWAKNRWAYYPDQGIDTRSFATYPRLSTTDNSNNYTNSSFWIKDGSFLRLRNIEFGYSLPKNVLSKIKLSNGRIYVNGVNLLTFSPLLSHYNIDPETMSGYPGVKSYNLGITVDF